MGENNVEQPKEEIKEEVKVGPERGGLMKRTLKELETLRIKLKDVFSFDNVSFNLEWDQVIRLVNYNANRQVLKWSHTFEEAITVIGIFLM